MKLSAPTPLTAQHATQSFDCGTDSLNDWLKRRALKNQIQGASRTYVLTSAERDGMSVLAYYALSAGAVASSGATGRLRRNMPDPIPMVMLGRLAVDLSLQGQGIGRALMRDAALRLIQSAGLIGIRGLLVQALNEDAKRFYQKLGFEPSPMDDMLLMITLADLTSAS